MTGLEHAEGEVSNVLIKDCHLRKSGPPIFLKIKYLPTYNLRQ